MAYAGSEASFGLVWARYDVCKTFAEDQETALESQLEPFSPIREKPANGLVFGVAMWSGGVQSVV
jgi:hypothetical protein